MKSLSLLCSCGDELRTTDRDAKLSCDCGRIYISTISELDI